MGIGNKPFMDIKPSDSAISDRAVDYIMKGSESRMRASIAVSSFDHSTPFKRPHSTISNSSSSSSGSQSSSSLLGSLNLHLSPSHPSHPSLSHWPYDCIEEDELEHDSTLQSSIMSDGVDRSSDRSSVQHHPALLMESYSSSPSPPNVSSSVLELQNQSSTFITAL